MYKTELFSQSAVANRSGAPEADTGSKNGRSPKIRRNRGNILKMASFILMFCLSTSLQAQGLTDMQKMIAETNFTASPDVQIEVYKHAMTKKDNEELQIYFASFIHKYDLSVRSEAYKATVATGNPRVIASANVSLDQVNWEGVDKSLKVNSSSTTSTPYLSTSISSVNFSSSGGTREITVNTNDNDWACSEVSDWCILTKNGNTIRLVCNANNGNARSDYFLVWYGERGTDGERTKNVRVNVTQDAGVKTPGASIQNVWLEHGAVVGQTTNSVYNYFYGWQYQNVNVYGMKIHVKFEVENMLYKQGTIVAWFYYENDNKLIMNNQTAYTASDGHLAVSDRFTPNYEGAVYNDFVLTMPNNELPSNLKGATLKVKVGILDNNNNQIAVSEYKSFNMK